MDFKQENGFTCSHCGSFSLYWAPGTRNRNHCPVCLFSIHIDNLPGDRDEKCLGQMTPIGLILKSNEEESIIHKCLKCGFERHNRVAGDDNQDIIDSLARIA